MEDILNLTIEEFEEILKLNKFPSYIYQQVYDWIFNKYIFDFDKMTNLNLKCREFLKNNYSIDLLDIVKKQNNKDTIKYLFKLTDENLIESVIMKHKYGTSICISSQIGCNMGCKFCESGRLKKIRNLSIGEMVNQILTVNNDTKDLNKKITSVVVMGIGEPFDNYDNVLNFIKIINNKYGFNIGARHITVSTSGIVKGIEKYSKEQLQINLAVSLHAPNDDIRNKIMPINKAYNVKILINSIKNYIEKTNRKVGIEYVMLKDINDSKKCAEDLVNLLKNMNIYVNLIEYNKTENTEFLPSDKQTLMNFYNILKKNNIDVCIRRSFGNNIDGACGQLKANFNKKQIN